MSNKIVKLVSLFILYSLCFESLYGDDLSDYNSKKKYF